MSIRRAARTDSNKGEIVSAMEAAGAYVYDLRQPVDLLVGYRGRTLLVEVKDGSKPPSRQKHTPDQIRFFERWLGGPVVTVRDVEGARRALAVVATSHDGLRQL